MKRYGIIISLLILLLPIQTKAIICSNEDQVRLQKLASQVTLNYTYREENGNVIFQAVISNIHEDLIIYDVRNNVRYPYTGPEIVIDGLSQGTSYRFNIVTDKYFCHHENLYTRYLNTPNYNPYYKDEVCVGNENESLCNKWQKINVSYEEWKKQVEDRKKQTVEQTIEEEKTSTTIIDYIIEFYLNYYYVILPIFIIGGMIIIYQYNRKDDLF